MLEHKSDQIFTFPTRWRHCVVKVLRLFFRFVAKLGNKVSYQAFRFAFCLHFAVLAIANFVIPFLRI